MSPQKNLFIVYDPSRFGGRDISDISNQVVRRAPEISIYIVHPRDTATVVKAAVWNCPSLTVSLVGRTSRFVPLRGPVLENRPLSKVEQYRRMCAAGLPMPRTAIFRRGEVYREEDWGRLVVLKPADLKSTSYGKNVRLMRTRRLNEISMGAAAPWDMADTLVQSFIDTGVHPTIWRAMTFFGHTLYCMKSWSPKPRPALDAPDSEIEAAVIEPKQPEIVQAYEVPAMRALAHDPEVVEFARRVHETVPTYPLLGCDIIRDEETGMLSLIEMNAGGNVWHFSSRRASRGLAVITREHRISQYGAWDIAADVLVEKVRQFAR
jgi:hypothetical protein